MLLDTLLPEHPASSGTMRRIGTLCVRDWHAKLYGMAAEGAKLKAEDLTRAERAYRAGIATPYVACRAGFALLRTGVEPGSSVLSVYWWEGAMLCRAARLLPGCGSAPRRLDAAADQLATVGEALLIGREAAAWQRCALARAAPSLDAYLAECCA